jgi:hypothetical protein
MLKYAILRRLNAMLKPGIQAEQRVMSVMGLNKK